MAAEALRPGLSVNHCTRFSAKDVLKGGRRQKKGAFAQLGRNHANLQHLMVRPCGNGLHHGGCLT